MLLLTFCSAFKVIIGFPGSEMERSSFLGRIICEFEATLGVDLNIARWLTLSSWNVNIFSEYLPWNL